MVTNLTAIAKDVELAKKASLEKANKFYSTAITEYNCKNYHNATDWFKYAYTLYKQVGDNQGLEKCENFIDTCHDLIMATNALNSANEDYKNQQYRSALQNLNNAKTIFSNYKSDQLKVVEQMIDDCNKKLYYQHACDQYNKGLEYSKTKDYHYSSNLQTAIELFEEAEKYFNRAGCERDAKDCRRLIEKCEDELDYIDEQERIEQEEREREREERENYRLGEEKFNDGVYYYQHGNYTNAKYCFEDAEDYGYEVNECRQYIDSCNEPEEEPDDDIDIDDD